MEVTGLLKVKFDTQKVSDKFTKRDFVLTTDASTPYPQQVSFQLTQDKCASIDALNRGEEVKVHFNLRGREWNGPQGVKYFNTLEAWKVEKVAAGTSAAASTTGAAKAPAANTNVAAPAAPSEPVFHASNDNDDLPF
jgi:hypothetical protein